MVYQVIARKWRPQVFEEVVGQDAITRTLGNAIKHDRLHHAYVFSGARGVGKTTTARLLAKALNCHKTDGPNPVPCDTNQADACPSCVEISEGRSMDVLEFDAASHTKVEEIREIILEGINIYPARDRYKVFIIDEFHMLSKSSFNALLKTLEEPPEKVVFIMATTEHHKVPVTIASRCQEFEFHTIPVRQIFDRLRLIADTEGIKAEDRILVEIARSGEGSMRDAQSNFDQVISFSDGAITAENVAVALGIASAETVLRSIRAIGQKNRGELLEIVDGLANSGHDLVHFCNNLMICIRDILIYKLAGAKSALIEASALGDQGLGELGEFFDERDLIRYFHSLAETSVRMREANDPRYLLEIGLLKLVEMSVVTPLSDVIARLGDLEASVMAPDGGAELASTDPETSDPGLEALSAAADSKKKLLTEPPPSETEHVIAGHGTHDPAPGESGIPTTPDDSSSVAPDSPSGSSNENETGIRGGIDLDNLPVRLLPITAEELEHTEDKLLDSDYETRLLNSGDDLRPIKNAVEIASMFLKRPEDLGETDDKPRDSNGSGVNKAVEIAVAMGSEGDETYEMPVLPDNPTESDLVEFAKNHPSVKPILRLFRGKVVSVKKK